MTTLSNAKMPSLKDKIEAEKVEETVEVSEKKPKKVKKVTKK